MRLGSNRAVVALALAFGILGSSNSGAVRPEPVAEGADLITPVWTPLGVSKAPVTVVVQLAGDSVAEQQGNAGRKLERGEKDRIKGQLRSQQDGLRGSIESLGGTVVANYQAAYNGIKVRIAHDRVKELAALPGVVAVRPLQLMKPDNVRGIPLIGTPAVWQSLGLHGEGVKIAIIDTGIDYTHANFGGPGTAAAYTAAHAKETLPADPRLFGPSAPRIKGGKDLVGDSYNPDPSNPLTYQPIPHPDPNPLDCNGHGSHVAGTAAGSGVTSAGTTYTGPYNASTLAAPDNFNIGPGVAPTKLLEAIGERHRPNPKRISAVCAIIPGAHELSCAVAERAGGSSAGLAGAVRSSGRLRGAGPQPREPLGFPNRGEVRKGGGALLRGGMSSWMPALITLCLVVATAVLILLIPAIISLRRSLQGTPRS